MTIPKIHARPLVWQILFIICGTSWLLAPGLNHHLSDRTTLISQYEVSGQPYAWLFRAADLIAGLLLLWVALIYYRRMHRRLPIVLLIIIGAGMVIDPVFTSNCLAGGSKCTETHSLTFLVHAIESLATGLVLFTLSAYDARYRHKLVSILYVFFQVGYGLLFLTQYADRQHFNTASQYVYQYISVIWLAWFVRDYLFNDGSFIRTNSWKAIVRYSVSIWILINGLLAILLSLSHISLLGKAQDLYFSRDTAWLAQHRVTVGIIMLYLFRHLLRGERRARQIILGVIGFEALKYAVVSPNWVLASLYGFSFCLLFVTVDEFSRGTVPLTWKLRMKDLAYLGGALALACLLVLIALDRDSRVSRITDQSYRHFLEYALHSDKVHLTHKESVLLANTTTAFIAASSGAILWILFKPYNLTNRETEDYSQVKNLLKRYANSSEDFFKLWPKDKQYFYGTAENGFIAYKIVGSIAFALADPISELQDKNSLINQFIGWARTRRLSVCFLPVTEVSLNLYEDLTPIQIGASALVNINNFISKTYEEKWWRWKRNRAIKQGYIYEISNPPHASALLSELHRLSNNWLTTSNHQERGFALGYFDKTYLQQCKIHYLKNQSGELVAFANQLPIFNNFNICTVDLMRYRADATDTMSYLLANIIKACGNENVQYFDLGFVPYAETKGSLLAIAQTLSSSRFSAKGLRQFKNKFKPEWQKVYLTYDGDLIDLGVIALHIESVMKKS